MSFSEMADHTDVDLKASFAGNLISLRNLKSYHMPMHDHHELQLLIPFEGAHAQVSWCLADKELETKTIGAADICLIPPFQEHEVRWINRAHFLSLCIETDFICSSIDPSFDREEQLFQTLIGFSDEFLYPLAIATRSAIQRHGLELERGDYFHSVFTVATRYLIDRFVDPIEQKNLFNGFAQIPCSKMRDAVAFMSGHLDRALRVEEVADQVKMSHYHFVRQFKEHIGTTPSRFHLQLRLEEAKKLLRQQHDIASVAYALGFSSQSHFHNSFLKYVGQTPKTFAKA